MPLTKTEHRLTKQPSSRRDGSTTYVLQVNISCSFLIFVGANNLPGRDRMTNNTPPFFPIQHHHHNDDDDHRSSILIHPLLLALPICPLPLLCNVCTHADRPGTTETSREEGRPPFVTARARRRAWNLVRSTHCPTIPQMQPRRSACGREEGTKTVAHVR